MSQFSMIDKFESIIPMEKACAVRGLTMTEGIFSSHFPNFPILPGVLIIKAFEDVAIQLIKDSYPQLRVIKILDISGVKFRKYLRPGDRLNIEVKFLERKNNNVFLSGLIRVNSLIVAELKRISFYIEEGQNDR